MSIIVRLNNARQLSNPAEGLDQFDDPRFRPVEEFMPEDEREEWLQYLEYLGAKPDKERMSNERMSSAEKDAIKKFCNNEILTKLRDEAVTKASWNYGTAIGDSIRERYEGLWLTIVEVTNVCVRKGAKGLFWIVTSPEIASIFESMFAHPLEPQREIHIPIGGEEICNIGVIKSKWRLFADPKWNQNEILIGANWNAKPEHAATITVINFAF